MQPSSVADFQQQELLQMQSSVNQQILAAQRRLSNKNNDDALAAATTTTFPLTTTQQQMENRNTNFQSNSSILNSSRVVMPPSLTMSQSYAMNVNTNSAATTNMNSKASTAAAIQSLNQVAQSAGMTLEQLALTLSNNADLLLQVVEQPKSNRENKELAVEQVKPSQQQKMQLALNLYQLESTNLYKRCMLLGGYMMKDIMMDSNTTTNNTDTTNPVTLDYVQFLARACETEDRRIKQSLPNTSTCSRTKNGTYTTGTKVPNTFTANIKTYPSMVATTPLVNPNDLSKTGKSGEDSSPPSKTRDMVAAV